MEFPSVVKDGWISMFKQMKIFIQKINVIAGININVIRLTEEITYRF
jgi:hypothetical protein